MNSSIDEHSLVNEVHASREFGQTVAPIRVLELREAYFDSILDFEHVALVQTPIYIYRVPLGTGRG